MFGDDHLASHSPAESPSLGVTPLLGKKKMLEVKEKLIDTQAGIASEKIKRTVREPIRNFALLQHTV